MTLPIDLENVSFVGSGLARPECVLCTRAGDVFAADARGGVLHLLPDGAQRLYCGRTNDLRSPFLPNGVALDRDGSFLVAHICDGEGGVFRLRRDGVLLPVLREVDGETMSATNFVMLDRLGRIWITVSTRQVPRDRGFRDGVDDGYIVLIDGDSARIVADGLGFANEVRIDAEHEWLYVNETYSRRLTRFRLDPSGSLSHREVFATFGHGTYPDGLAFDADGGIWVTSIVSNRLIRIDRQGAQTVMLEECDARHVHAVELAYEEGTLARGLIDQTKARALRSLSSIAFGGPDLQTAYLGVLLGDRLPCVRVPFRGEPMVHWNWR